jgi:hypothetical protein
MDIYLHHQFRDESRRCVAYQLDRNHIILDCPHHLRTLPLQLLAWTFISVDLEDRDLVLQQLLRCSRRFVQLGWIPFFRF